MTEGHHGHRTHYDVTGFVPVVGQPVKGIDASSKLVRVEGSAPILLDHKVSDANTPMVHFRGVTQHLHYTGKEDKEKLTVESRLPVTASAETTAVMIPIRKSAAWWALTQDQRQAFFHKTKTSAGHTQVGLPFAGKIFRKLYHSRYTGTPLPYDFVTYFEFPTELTADFKQLLAQLRDPKTNPEWESVELEFEIWMTKVGED